MGLRRRPVRMLDTEGGTDGQVPVISGGKFVIGDAGAASGAVGLYVTTPEAHGAAGDGTTDDTAAFLLALIAIIAAGGGVLLLGAKTYLVNGALVTTSHGNAVLSIPGGCTVPIAIIGVQPANNCDPRTSTGYSVIKTTKTGLSHDATHGCPSLLGGPTDDAHWAETTVTLQNFCIWLPHNPTISGIDLRYVRRSVIDGVTVVAINTGDADFVQPTSIYQFGVRTPDSLNFNTVLVRNAAASGCYAGLVGTVESLTLDYWSSKWCVLGWGPGCGGHAANVGKMSLEWCQYHLGGWSETAGVTSLPNSHSSDTKAVISAQELDLEDAPTSGSPWYATVEHIHDPTNKLYGVVFYNRTVSGVGPTTGLTVNGAANLTTECLLAPSLGGGSALAVEDEGTSIDAAVSSLDFTGDGVTATSDGSGNVTVTIPGGSGGRWEALMASGVSFPAEQLESSAGGDWLYGEVTP